MYVVCIYKHVVAWISHTFFKISITQMASEYIVPKKAKACMTLNICQRRQVLNSDMSWFYLPAFNRNQGFQRRQSWLSLQRSLAGQLEPPTCPHKTPNKNQQDSLAGKCPLSASSNHIVMINDSDWLFVTRFLFWKCPGIKATTNTHAINWSPRLRVLLPMMCKNVSILLLSWSFLVRHFSRRDCYVCNCPGCAFKIRSTVAGD